QLGAHHRVGGGKTTTVSDREKVSPQGRQFDLGKQQRFSCAGHREGTAIRDGAVRRHHRAQTCRRCPPRERSILARCPTANPHLQLGHEVLSDKVTVSPEGLLMYGIEPEDDASSADFYFRRMHPKDRPEVEQAYAAALLGKTEFAADFRLVLPDGTIKNTRSIGHPILDERGDVVEFVGASIDVTEHHRERAELEKALEEIKRLRDQLHNENVVLREQIDQAFMFEEIVGTSSALQGVLSRLMKVAPTDSSVFVSGET